VSSASSRRLPRQDLALNLSAKRRLCNTVGGRSIEVAARCCALFTARSRAAARTNLARSNQSLVLRWRFGGAKRSALRQYLHDLPPMVGWWLADKSQILPLIAAIWWHPYMNATWNAQKESPRAPGLKGAMADAHHRIPLATSRTNKKVRSRRAPQSVAGSTYA